MVTTQLKRTEGQVGRRRRFELPFETLFEEMDRMWGAPLLWPARLGGGLPRADRWFPSVDVFEKEGQLVIQAELPGLKKEDVEVTVHEGRIIMKGERKEDSRVEKEDFLRLERARGSFYRSFPLPSGIDPAGIKAEFKDGVLEVRLPKPIEKEMKAERIPIG